MTVLEQDASYMAEQSMEQVRLMYITTMGKKLGTTSYELYCRLVELHILWQQYRQLFVNDPEIIRLLNRTSGLFFKIVQDELWNSVLLGISRMTDPPATAKNKNLTIQSLPPLVTDPVLQIELQSLCNKAVSAAEFAREHRNKRIAHLDHSYLIDKTSKPLTGISIDSVENMLSALGDVLNHLNKHFRDTTVSYRTFVDETGARLLVQKLKKFESLQGTFANSS